jgi:hypothetical protein
MTMPADIDRERGLNVMLLQAWLEGRGLSASESIVTMTLLIGMLCKECTEPERALKTVTRGLKVAVSGSSPTDSTAH